MASFFVAYFYSVCGSGMDLLQRLPLADWTLWFFLPHVVADTRSALINAAEPVGLSGSARFQAVGGLPRLLALFAGMSWWTPCTSQIQTGTLSWQVRSSTPPRSAGWSSTWSTGNSNGTTATSQKPRDRKNLTTRRNVLACSGAWHVAGFVHLTTHNWPSLGTALFRVRSCIFLAYRNRARRRFFANRLRLLVEPIGIEPTTSSLRTTRSPN